MTNQDDPKEIYLEPACRECDPQNPEIGRCWAPEDAWGHCPECAKPATRYIRADLVTGTKTADIHAQVEEWPSAPPHNKGE